MCKYTLKKSQKLFDEAQETNYRETEVSLHLVTEYADVETLDLDGSISIYIIEIKNWPAFIVQQGGVLDWAEDALLERS